MKNKKRIGTIVILFLVIVVLCILLFVRCSDKGQTEDGSKTTIETGNHKKDYQEKKSEEDDSKTEPEKDDTVGEAATEQHTSETVPETESPAKQHTHDFVKTTVNVHHDATGHFENVCIKEAWTEQVPIYEEVVVPVCNVCRQEIVNETPAQHAKAHGYEGGGHHTELVQRQTGTNTVSHPAEYEQRWVIDQAAWDENTVIYKCSCGAVK